MEYETLVYDVRDGVATITLNRPDAANAVNLQLARDLVQVTLRCGNDAAVRAVLITGAGKMFCGGGDLKSFARHADALAQHLKEVTLNLHAAISHLARLEAPVIAAVNGSAAGAGMSLTCACDMVLAAESARFTMAYTRVGLTPDGSSTYFLSRIVGLRRALELTLTNRILSAAEALDLGLVTRVIPDPALMAEAQKLAAELAAGATRALGGAKRLLLSGWTETLETQLELESRAIAEMGRTADGVEGIVAFVEKRAPRFKGQ
jgi:2-(1,2-epoxy-1,2-dihydrophenyl)acetyl-CoA isomerase